ncbi:MAG: alanine dehydrogenase [Candidatus Aminicenantes bacterium]|nr:alanine dehydrogenase [Candidatus Aminicenantes bacterium]NIM81607.1 alanine dehydrogenase [Candidatus Aminicenantes bacterium]NIN20978.1 alanine dehydrogenase [Candidatus Aminicenantes bacterium]NIN44799.1 alanine dehydrogenase [Candidatus Aminicenantes bacterium]NIN87607.1 alanine dehydrogenase [Candidatus Aminicenantes bacterium]
MIFGIPKELSDGKDTMEMRVGLSPMGAQELIHYGAEVYVESKAGEGAGFTDENYIKAGANIVYSKEEAYRRADVVLKVRRPQPEEFSFINDGQVIMGFMHLITSPREFIEIVKEKKITLIGYEIIQRKDGTLPIVIPMSEIAGKLSVQLAGRLLESREGGRGILLGGIAGIPPAEVVILGAGTLGRSAARAFAGIGASVYVLDLDREKLDKLSYHTAGMNITTMFSTRHNIEKLVKFADVLIGAVQVPRKRTPILITKEMVKTMQNGAVLIDFSIDEGGCSETSKVAPLGKFVYTVDHVIHFCMPNATSLVARTATHSLTAGAIPYLRIISELGIERALGENKDLARGIYAEKGEIRKEFLV